MGICLLDMLFKVSFDSWEGSINHLVVLLSFGCLRLSFELISNGWIGFHRATDSSISHKKKFLFQTDSDSGCFILL